MWGIPTHCRTVAFGKRVAGEKIGTVLEAGAYAMQGMPGHFIKAKVLVDILQTLRSQLYASNPLAGEFWVTLVYEFLPMLYYHCGRLGHIAPNFSFLDPIGIEHYGPELTTEVIGYRVEEAAFIPQLLRPPIQPSVWVNPHTSGVGQESKKQKRDEGMEYIAVEEDDRPVVMALPAKKQTDQEQNMKHVQVKTVKQAEVIAHGSGYNGGGNFSGGGRGHNYKSKGKGGQGGYTVYHKGQGADDKKKLNYYRGGYTPQTGGRNAEGSRGSGPKQNPRGGAGQLQSRQTKEPRQQPFPGTGKQKGKEAFSDDCS
ncbi:unnamed protein product [Linum trigynum]|uniref:Uncharacterized protein n=1 Tax=Linum trigynum TaxID=586398 RepID=A0AAV2CEY5_9ROSI